MLFRWTTQTAFLWRTVFSGFLIETCVLSCLYYSYMVDTRELFKRGKIQILNAHFAPISSKLHLSSGNLDMQLD